MHKVAVLALNHFVAMDLAIAADVFGLPSSPKGKPLYDVTVYGKKPQGDWYGLSVNENLSDLKHADTIIVPGVRHYIETPIAPDILESLSGAYAHGVRLASVCTGAFVLAAAGILDGHKATTHWMALEALARLYPRIKVEHNVLFIDNGSVLTSAGVTSGVDLCLHMIRKDFGADVAAKTAEVIVMPLERDGRQPQLITQATPDSDDSLAPLLLWVMENLHHELTVDLMAQKAAMSSRTFNRKFKEQTGTTPLQWLLTARVKRAQQLLETTKISIENVATAAGFDSASSFRDRFQRVVGVAPSCWRNTYSQIGHTG